MRSSIVLLPVLISPPSVLARAESLRGFDNFPTLFARAPSITTTPGERIHALGLVMENEHEKQMAAASERRKALYGAKRWADHGGDQLKAVTAPDSGKYRDLSNINRKLGENIKTAHRANRVMADKADNIKRIGSINKALQYQMGNSAEPMWHWPVKVEHRLREPMKSPRKGKESSSKVKVLEGTTSKTPTSNVKSTTNKHYDNPTFISKQTLQEMVAKLPQPKAGIVRGSGTSSGSPPGQ